MQAFGQSCFTLPVVLLAQKKKTHRVATSRPIRSDGRAGRSGGFENRAAAETCALDGGHLRRPGRLHHGAQPSLTPTSETTVFLGGVGWPGRAGGDRFPQ